MGMQNFKILLTSQLLWHSTTTNQLQNLIHINNNINAKFTHRYRHKSQQLIATHLRTFIHLS